jgi:hypothetical protein
LPPFAAWNFIYLTKARRLAIQTKGALAVVQSKPSFEGYREFIENEDKPAEMWVATVVAKRRGFPEVVKHFSYADALLAGLLRERKNQQGQSYDSPWQSYVKDMLLSRARGRCLDIAFAAELGGFPIEGVAEDIDMMEERERGRARSEPARRAPRELAPPAAVDPLFAELAGGLRKTPEQMPVVLPASAVSVVPEVVGVKEFAAAAAAAPERCERCTCKLNLLSECDACGWPGADLR